MVCTGVISFFSFPADNTNKSTAKYHPANRCELEKLVADPSIKLADIDVSNVQDLSFILSTIPSEQLQNFDFRNKKGFECVPSVMRTSYEGVEVWDTSNATNMDGMFYDNEGFNIDIHNWDVSNVKSMKYMFSGANHFNKPLNTWDVSSVEDMSNMFDAASVFNQPLGNWDVSNIKTMNMMFLAAK